MPVIIATENLHPFFPSLGSGSAIAQERAEHQDIRPLEIAVLNLMADKVATEKQLAFWLGRTPLQVKLTFASTDRYVQDIAAGRESAHTPAGYIRKFYKAFSDIKPNKYDGLIVTGVNAQQARVTDESFWKDVEDVLTWSEENVFSSLFLCWGAKAALKHFYDIESVKAQRKISGVFEHYGVDDKAGLLATFPDRFPIPVSRWKTPVAADIATRPGLDVLANSQIGPSILVETAPFDQGRAYPRRLFVLCHPEYETDTLLREYERDRLQNPDAPLPFHYFPDDNPSRKPLNTWRYTGALYTNWVEAIYDAAPYHLADIPKPCAP